MIVERGTIVFGKHNIPFAVKRSGRRLTVSIFVDPVEGVFLRAPSAPSLESLSELVHSKATWILDKQRRMNETTELALRREFVTGETFLYLGRHLRLKVLTLDISHETTVSAQQGRFAVTVDANLADVDRLLAIRDALVDWYKRHALPILTGRSAVYAGKLSLPTPGVILGNQIKRWGSCDKNGQLRFNWRIVMAPMSLVDYVVAHEICHLRQSDHSKDFWRLLGNAMPDYESRRERLRKEGVAYRI
jgi:predicted metal-dependent hydrolase